MSEYHQFCGLARTLDVIGDRWSMLVVRELLIADRRHAELRTALPGIPRNLLVTRLHTLEDAGVLTRSQHPGHKAVVYALTGRGRQLRAPLLALVRWGAAEMAAGPRPDDVVQPQWIRLAAEAFADVRASAVRAAVCVDLGAMRLTLDVGPDGWRVADDADADADVRVAGNPAAVLGLLAGALDVDGARKRGAVIDDPHGVAAAVFGPNAGAEAGRMEG